MISEQEYKSCTLTPWYGPGPYPYSVRPYLTINGGSHKVPHEGYQVVSLPEFRRRMVEYLETVMKSRSISFQKTLNYWKAEPFIW